MNFLYDALGVVFGPVMSAIYQVVQNYGVAIILFTLFCRVLMLPSAVMQQKSQAKNQRMQLKMRKIQEKYKDDRQRLQQEQQEFYRREGYNPMSAGCSGGMLLQFPVMFGLISAIYRPLKYTLGLTDEVLSKLAEAAGTLIGDEKLSAANLQVQLRIAENIDKFKGLFGAGEGLIPQFWFDKIHEFAENFTLFGLKLGLTPKEGEWYYYIVPVLAGVTAMLSSLYTTLRQRKTGLGEKQNLAMMGCTVLGMPIFSAVISMGFPVGIGIYWIVSSLVGFLQIVVLGYTHPPQKMLAKVLVDETIERRSRENSKKKIATLDA
jgi:YidC/Oxa1 family membrane protein insertase